MRWKISLLLEKHYQAQVIILIDEYDVPLDKAFQHGYYEQMVVLMPIQFGDSEQRDSRDCDKSGFGDF